MFKHIVVERIVTRVVATESQSNVQQLNTQLSLWSTRQVRILNFIGYLFSTCVLLLIDLWNVFSIILDSIVVSYSLLTRNILNDLLCDILSHLLLVGNILDSRFSLDWGLIEGVDFIKN